MDRLLYVIMKMNLTLVSKIRLYLWCKHNYEIEIRNIYPLGGLTIRTPGHKVKIILNDTADGHILLHELVHASGGSEFTAEMMDAITGGTPPTPGELTEQQAKVVKNIRRRYM